MFWFQKIKGKFKPKAGSKYEEMTPFWLYEDGKCIFKCWDFFDIPENTPFEDDIKRLDSDISNYINTFLYNDIYNLEDGKGVHNNVRYVYRQDTPNDFTIMHLEMSKRSFGGVLHCEKIDEDKNLYALELPNNHSVCHH